MEIHAVAAQTTARTRSHLGAPPGHITRCILHNAKKKIRPIFRPICAHICVAMLSPIDSPKAPESKLLCFCEEHVSPDASKVNAVLPSEGFQLPLCLLPHCSQTHSNGPCRLFGWYSLCDAGKVPRPIPDEGIQEGHSTSRSRRFAQNFRP